MESKGSESAAQSDTGHDGTGMYLFDNPVILLVLGYKGVLWSD